MSAFGSPPQNKNAQNSSAPVLSEEEKQRNELQRLFDEDLKRAREAMKEDKQDVFVRSH